MCSFVAFLFYNNTCSKARGPYCQTLRSPFLAFNDEQIVKSEKKKTIKEVRKEKIKGQQIKIKPNLGIHVSRHSVTKNTHSFLFLKKVPVGVCQTFGILRKTNVI